jgi:pyruvate dehydrogenase E2 component (dihydrolipoamide acetyltransferase)
VIKAASIACMKVPQTNTSWQGDFIRKFNNVNIGVALKTEHGFLAPVIQKANLKGIEQIAKEVRAFEEKASKDELTLNDTDGATFTIANLGAYNVNSFVPIVNAP